MTAASKYATALELGQAAPTFVPGEDDKERVTAYWTYQDVYRNVKTAFDVVLRSADGEEISRRYVPAARTIIEGTNRYLCKDMEFVSSIPSDVTLSPEDAALTMEWLQKLFAREEFTAKFLSLKRWMLVRGDAMFHISADPNKPEGTRLRITELLPENYFPIVDPADTERVIGCYIVKVVLDDAEEEISQRIEYRRIINEEQATQFGTPIGGIFYKMGFYALDAWDDRGPEFDEGDLEEVDPPAAYDDEGSVLALAGLALPTEITAIPVYHFRNNREGSEIFGTSEIQGIETLLAGLIQNLTDEDLAVALQGIGVYYTDSGRPKDDQGNDVDWEIAPAAMIELDDGKTLGRVEGGKIDSMLKHMEIIERFARQTTATSDVAVGVVDVAVAQSGIALAIQMMPTTSKNAEKEEDIGSKLDQMLYDILNGWGPAYEGLNAGGLVVTVVFGDPLPVDRAAVVKEVTELLKAKAITIAFALSILKKKLGYDLDPVAMAGELATAAQAELDSMGARLDQAAAGEGA